MRARAKGTGDGFMRKKGGGKEKNCRFARERQWLYEEKARTWREKKLLQEKITH